MRCVMWIGVRGLFLVGQAGASGAVQVPGEAWERGLLRREWTSVFELRWDGGSQDFGIW